MVRNKTILMQKLIYLFLAVLLFVSCEKESSENKSHGTLKITTDKASTVLDYSTEDVAGKFHLDGYSLDGPYIYIELSGRTPDDRRFYLSLAAPSFEVGKTYTHKIRDSRSDHFDTGTEVIWSIANESYGLENFNKTFVFSELNIPGRTKGVAKGIDLNGKEFLKIEFDFVFVQEEVVYF